MKSSNDNQAVYWLLLQVMFRAKHNIHEIAERYGLTLMQSNTLTMLKEDEPLAMNVLSNYFMCDASNITGIADRLETQGLIKRQDHPSDRRIKMIALTSKGIKLRSKIIAETVEAEATRLKPVLSEDERATLQAILKKIVTADSSK